MRAIEDCQLKGLEIVEDLIRLEEGMALFEAREPFICAKL
jgi:hypothetical protein